MIKINKSALRDKLNIVDVIARYISLKKSGKNYVGLCPFHLEKTPSFTVNEQKQIFHCFGCGVGGDVVEFLSKYLKINPYEAVVMIEKETGLKLIEGGKEFEKKQLEIKKILEINKKAVSFFIHNLFKTDEGRACLIYLNKRHVSIETIKRFFLGYGGVEWDRLVRFFESNGYSRSDIEKAGLAVQSYAGLRDFFRNRLVFPIINRYSEAVGFGGRALDDSLPKYINSPENLVFSKRKQLFGIKHAFNAMQRENAVYVVEGYMDCIMMHQAGFTNTVATLGTAITEEHVRYLKGIVSNYYLILDGDEAGQKAALKATEIFINQGLSPNIVVLSGDEDPDSLIANDKINILKEAIENSKKGIDFLINFYKIKYSLFTTEGLRNFLHDINKHLLNITNSLEKEIVYREVAKAINVAPEQLITMLGAIEQSKEVPVVGIDNVAFTPEDHIVMFLINNPSHVNELDFIMDEMSPQHKEIINKICFNSVRELSDDAEVLFRKLSLFDFHSTLDDELQAFKNNLIKIKLRKIKRLKDDYTRKISLAESAGNLEDAKMLMEEKSKLIKIEKEILKGVQR